MERKRTNENGSISAKAPFAQELPPMKITLQSGHITYRFTGSYDGRRSLSSKVLRLMEQDDLQKGDGKADKER